MPDPKATASSAPSRYASSFSSAVWSDCPGACKRTPPSSLEKRLRFIEVFENEGRALVDRRAERADRRAVFVLAPVLAAADRYVAKRYFYPALNGTFSMDRRPAPEPASGLGQVFGRVGAFPREAFLVPAEVAVHAVGRKIGWRRFRVSMMPGVSG